MSPAFRTSRRREHFVSHKPPESIGGFVCILISVACASTAPKSLAQVRADGALQTRCRALSIAILILFPARGCPGRERQGVSSAATFGVPLQLCERSALRARFRASSGYPISSSWSATAAMGAVVAERGNWLRRASPQGGPVEACVPHSATSDAGGMPCSAGQCIPRPAE